MFLAYKGHRVHFSDSGNGKIVVLLHGYLETREVWNGFEKRLASDYRVISIDLPGHGQSDVYGETHSMEFMAGVLKALFESLGIKKVFMAGHSLGGYVTLAFLDLYPDYLSGYCLFHSHPLADSPEATEKRMTEIALVKAGKKDVIYPENLMRMFAPSNVVKFSKSLERMRDIASGLPENGIIAVLNGMMIRPSRASVMAEGQKPCLWILGAMDNYIPCSLIQTRVNIPDNTTVVVLSNSGHIGFIEEEELSLKVISEFIGGIK